MCRVVCACIQASKMLCLLHAGSKDLTAQEKLKIKKAAKKQSHHKSLETLRALHHAIEMSRGGVGLESFQFSLAMAVDTLVLK